MFKYTTLFLAFIFLFSPFSADPALSQDQPEAPPEAKNSPQEAPCPAPSIKELLPRAAAAGAKVTIVGFGFGSAPGEAVFPGSAQAQIISWQPQRIVVAVPPGKGDVLKFPSLKGVRTQEIMTKIKTEQRRARRNTKKKNRMQDT